MKKIKYLIIPMLSFIGIFLCSEKVNATTYETLKIEPQANVYYAMTGDDGYFSADPFSYYTMNGKTVYCVEQGVPIHTSSYIGTEGYSSSPFSNEVNRKLELIGHYGYDYPNHQTLKFRMATQALIWETITGYNVNFYTENYGWGDYIDVSYEREQIMNLVNNHLIKPSFDSQTFNLKLNETIEIEDFNNKLSEFQVFDSNNNDVKIENNKVFITAKTIGQSEILFVKKYYDNSTTFFYRADDGVSQKVAFFRTKDPLLTYLNINVVGGKIKIKKIDNDTKSCTTGLNNQYTLVGAKYGIYDINNNLVETLTIGNDCTATSKYLPYGAYTVKEISTPIGYELDEKIYNVNIDSTNIVEITSNENVTKGKIKIKKIDNDTKSCTTGLNNQYTLVGAKYGIYDINNNLVETLTIGNDCTATSKYLPYGAYTVKEISTPIGYELDEKIYNVNIDSTNIVEITSNENVIKGKIKIKKIDNDTKSCVVDTNSQYTLVGAKYGIYDINNNLVETLTIGDDCTATSKYLPYGAYTIKEISTPVGYTIDTNIYDANITNEKTIEITSPEKVIKNDISILKQYESVNGNTTFLNAESGIIFEIFYPNGSKYGEVTTDKNGYARFEIPYGVWKLHQKNSTTGYEKIYDFFITVDEDSEKIQYYNILNNSLSAYLQVYKIDSETGNTIAIANTTFKILNIDTNQYVSQYVGGKVYSEFKTDDNGVMTTYLKLDSGNYKLIEISSPHNYLINPDGLEFSIGEDTEYGYTTYGAFVTVYFENQVIKGQIEINKKGEDVIIENGNFIYKQKNLENVVFEIYANEDILSADGNILYYEKDQLVDTIITNKDGYAISSKLPLGNYYLIERKTQDGYILDENKHYFTLKQIDNETPIVYESYSTLNHLKKGTLEFTKTDVTTGKCIPNVKLEIYTSNDELIYSGVTDENGKITIENLFVGKFYIIETEALTGYKLSDEKVFFEILENGEVVKSTMTNEKIKGDLEFTKVDLSTGKPLPNTLIEIYTDADELIFSGCTDDNGKIIIKELEYGKYYIIEKEAPNGYTLNPEKMYFEILEDGEVVKATMSNEKVIVPVPNTMSNEIDFVYIFSIIVMIGGIIVIIYENKNKKK